MIAVARPQAPMLVRGLANLVMVPTALGLRSFMLWLERREAQRPPPPRPTLADAPVQWSVRLELPEVDLAPPPVDLDDLRP